MMHREEIKTLVEFVNSIDGLDLIVGHNLFRGQDRPGNLLPGVARLDPTRDTTEAEKLLLDELLRMGATRIPSGTDTRLDALILAQHFGLKTRLLDWTSNPLVALWFACYGDRPGNGYVYWFDADSHLLDLPDDPFDIARTVAVRPKLGNERILAQHGWFTLHRYSKEFQKFVALEHNKDARTSLIEFIIPENCRTEIIRVLDKCGVNRSTLIPDLEGLCQYLNWKHGFYPPAKVLR